MTGLKAAMALVTLSKVRSTDVLRAVQSRMAVLTLCLGIVAWRTPRTFTGPQFWGEDADFFYRAYWRGFAILGEPVAGYLVSIQSLVAAMTSYFPPVAAPAIYGYTAVLLTLVVLRLVTSPRLDMPYKPLLAVAVVIVPMAKEEIGILTNIQWILPIGAFALLFMRASPSRAVLAAEALFVAAMALSGPFSLLLAPLFVWRMLTCSDAADRSRLTVLTGVIVAAALTQAAVMSQHSGPVIYPTTAVAYPWTLWITLPLTKLLSTFQIPSRTIDGVAGVVIGLALAAGVAALAALRPYRAQKIFMILFATGIMFSGMYKFRMALEGQTGAQRYFYAGCVFSLWFICCLPASRKLRIAPAVLVAVVELLLLPSIFNNPWFNGDLEWKSWARQISSGLPVIVPTLPHGFYISLPASAEGPLARFAPWLGRDFPALANDADTRPCDGQMGDIVPVTVANPQSVPKPDHLWFAGGHGWDTTGNQPLQLVLLVDAGNRVTGYGFPGFTQHENASAPPQSGWKAFFYATSIASIQAYGVADDGRRICKLPTR